MDEAREIQPAFSVVIREPFAYGMFRKLQEQKLVCLRASDAKPLGTKVEYFPCGVKIDTGELFMLPATEWMTRAALIALLEEQGFHVHNEG
jgi:hypothetical protein